MNTDGLEDSLDRCFISANVLDSNLEPANLVDVVQRLAGKVEKMAEALEVGPLRTQTGLERIAEAIFDLAAAVREHSA